MYLHAWQLLCLAMGRGKTAHQELWWWQRFEKLLPA
jgi:hypothetical protein